jgi:hypothetical protein
MSSRARNARSRFSRVSHPKDGAGATGAGRVQMAVAVSTFRKAMVALVAVAMIAIIPMPGMRKAILVAVAIS